MTDAQKQYVLRQQMKAIQSELGEGDGEVQELRKRIAEAHLPDHVAAVANREVDRLERMTPAAPEYQMITDEHRTTLIFLTRIRGVYLCRSGGGNWLYWRAADVGASLMMNNCSPGRINPSSRRANASMVAGSSRSCRASSRIRAFSVRASAKDSCSARYCRRALIMADSPLSPTNASTTSTQPMNINRYRNMRRAGRRVMEDLDSARDIGLSNMSNGN